MSAGPEVVAVEWTSPLYPAPLRDRLSGAPPRLRAVGSLALLLHPPVSLLGSVRVPAGLVLPSLSLAGELRAAGIPVAGGFHAPLERDWLEVLLRGGGPVVVCLARDPHGMRVPRGWREALEQGRMLLLSMAPPGRRRPTAELAEARNRLTAALGRALVVPHADPGGRVHHLAAEAARWGVPLFTLEHPQNRHLLLLGARPVQPGVLAEAIGASSGRSVGELGDARGQDQAEGATAARNGMSVQRTPEGVGQMPGDG